MFRFWPELPHARVGSLIGYIRRFRRPQTQKSVTYKSRDLERPQTFRNQINVKIRLEEIHRFASRTACDAILLKPTMAFILCQPLTWTRLSCPGIPHGQLWSRRLSVQLITCETSHTAHQVLYIYIYRDFSCNGCGFSLDRTLQFWLHVSKVQPRSVTKQTHRTCSSHFPRRQAEPSTILQSFWCIGTFRTWTALTQ